jgi:plastocyanin domain-containing protein
MKLTQYSVITALVLALSGGTVLAKDKANKGNAAMAQHEQVITIEVTKEGFVPAEVKVKAGHPVKLVVTRKVDRTCATEIVIKDFGINKPLPLNQPVEVTFTPSKPGKIRYACGMDMIAGTIVVE